MKIRQMANSSEISSLLQINGIVIKFQYRTDRDSNQVVLPALHLRNKMTPNYWKLVGMLL